MTDRVSILIEGPYAVWDPESPAAFAELAGDLYVGPDGDGAVVRPEGCPETTVYPGWAVVRTDSGARFVAPPVLASGTRG